MEPESARHGASWSGCYSRLCLGSNPAQPPRTHDVCALARAATDVSARVHASHTRRSEAGLAPRPAARVRNDARHDVSGLSGLCGVRAFGTEALRLGKDQSTGGDDAMDYEVNVPVEGSPGEKGDR